MTRTRPDMVRVLANVLRCGITGLLGMAALMALLPSGGRGIRRMRECV